MRSTRRWWVILGIPPVAVASLVLCIPVLLLPGRTSAAGTGAVNGIPERVLRAYRAADGWCPGLRWQMLAGVGSVESSHASSGGVATDPASGEVRPPIFGPPLDGSAGVMRLPVGSWLGWFGLAGPWQQAVGPMQFLPSTFEAWGVDGDYDGVANPHDIDDAVASAANYLCGGNQGEITDERSALLRYNNDEGYIARVLAYADELRSAESMAILCPVAGPTTFTNTWLAPRSGGRRHEGVDMFAAEGTPVVAPVDGEVELREGPSAVSLSNCGPTTGITTMGRTCPVSPTAPAASRQEPWSATSAPPATPPILMRICTSRFTLGARMVTHRTRLTLLTPSPQPAHTLIDGPALAANYFPLKK